MDETTYKSLIEVINYLYEDERKDYEANKWPKGHIFPDIERVCVWIDEVAKDYQVTK